MTTMTAPIKLYYGQTLKINGLNYHYLDEGQGDPVVMLHGNPTWSVYYRELFSALKSQYRCIVPDHIGCGFSDKPDAKDYAYTLEQRVNDLETLLETLGITQNVTLVVHDWGGMIGMAWASRHPEALKRLVLLNTAAFHLPSEKPFPWPLWLGRDTQFGAWLIQRGNAFSKAAAWVGCTRQRMDRYRRAAYQMPYNSWQNRIATLRFVQDIPLRSGDSGYELVSQVQNNLTQFAHLPILICWGEKDFVFDEPFLKQWLKYYPDAELHRFPDCGHYILEDASTEIIPLVQQFLTKHPLAVPA